MTIGKDASSGQGHPRIILYRKKRGVGIDADAVETHLPVGHNIRRSARPEPWMLSHKDTRARRSTSSPLFMSTEFCPSAA